MVYTFISEKQLSGFELKTQIPFGVASGRGSGVKRCQKSNMQGACFVAKWQLKAAISQTTTE